MPAIPPNLLRAIPTLTQVVGESAPPTLDPHNLTNWVSGELQARLSERLLPLVDELVQAQIQALRPVLRERILQVVQEVVLEINPAGPQPHANTSSKSPE